MAGQRKTLIDGIAAVGAVKSRASTVAAVAIDCIGASSNVLAGTRSALINVGCTQVPGETWVTHAGGNTITVNRARSWTGFNGTRVGAIEGRGREGAVN